MLSEFGADAAGIDRFARAFPVARDRGDDRLPDGTPHLKPRGSSPISPAAVAAQRRGADRRQQDRRSTVVGLWRNTRGESAAACPMQLERLMSSASPNVMWRWPICSA
jgi:hypothetical protein